MLKLELILGSLSMQKSRNVVNRHFFIQTTAKVNQLFKDCITLLNRKSYKMVREGYYRKPP